MVNQHLKWQIQPRPGAKAYFSRATSPYSQQSICLVSTLWAGKDDSHYRFLHNTWAVDGHGHAPSILQRKKNQKNGLFVFSPFIFIRCLIIRGLWGISACFHHRTAPPQLKVWEQASAGKLVLVLIQLGHVIGIHERMACGGYQLSEPACRPSPSCLGQCCHPQKLYRLLPMKS